MSKNSTYRAKRAERPAAVVAANRAAAPRVMAGMAEATAKRLDREIDALLVVGMSDEDKAKADALADRIGVLTGWRPCLDFDEWVADIDLDR